MTESGWPSATPIPPPPPGVEPRSAAGPRRPAGAARGGKSLTIGAVCKALSQEFPDISISKIRYLEDQKLLAPRRTPGGYRLYSATTCRACARSCASSATSSCRCG